MHWKSWMMLGILFCGGCAWRSQPTPVALRPEFVRQSQNRKVVIFVHGVTGSSRATWTNDRSGAYWPELLRDDPAFNDYDIYAMNYDTPYFRRTATIEETATQTLQRLIDQDIFSKYQEVFIIAHSMGGLLAKRWMIQLNRSATQPALRTVRGILFLSTPAQGSQAAEISNWIRLNPQIHDMLPADLNSFLQGLENDWDSFLRDRDLKSLDQRFPKVYCAYETQPTFGILIVNRVYAASRCDNTPYPVSANHVDIVKPEDRDSDVYVWAKKRIFEAASPADFSPQFYSIQGQVIDRFSRNYVRNARVELEQNPQNFFCCVGDDGVYVLDHVPKSTASYYTIRASLENRNIYSGTVVLNPTAQNGVIKKNLVVDLR